MKTRVIVLVLAVLVAGLAPILGHTAGPTDVAGVPAALVGQHGPTSDFTSGPLELVGHTDLTPPGATKPLGNNGGVALIDHCAYVGRWHDYNGRDLVQIVDVANPAAPAAVGGVPGSAVKGSVTREIRAIDLPNGFQMLTMLVFVQSLTSQVGAVRTPGDLMLYYTFPSGDCTKPSLAGTFDMRVFRGHEFFQWLDPNPAHNVGGHPRVLDYITTPLSGTDMIVVDASNPASPSLYGVYNGGQPLASVTEANLVGGVPVGAGRYSHSISLSPDGTRAYISHWDGGYFTLDSSDFANAAPVPLFKPLGLASIPLPSPTVGNTHSSVRLPGTNDVVEGDEIYVTTDGCPFGWMHVIDTGNASTGPSRIGEFKLAENNATNCSGVYSADRNSLGLPVDGTFTMHNQTVTGRYVLTSWYGGGLRVVDVSNPSSPAQTAFFVPAPLPAISSVLDTSAPPYGAAGDPNTDANDWWVATWSYPVLRHDAASGSTLIYVADIRNGLYILRATPGSDLAANLDGIGFLEGNSNLGDFR